MIERRVAKSSARFQAMKALTNAGIFAGVLLMPVLPFITDHAANIRQIISLAHAAGARYIYPAFGMTLRDNQREHYYHWLDKLYPDLKQQYIRIFGLQYNCVSPRRRQLEQLFQQECEQRGMLYRMPDIIAAYKQSKEPEQLQLF